MNMKHLINNSVYDSSLEMNFPEPIDGTELLTGYNPIPDSLVKSKVTSVHLPYAIDWYATWSGNENISKGMSDDEIRYMFYGRNKEDIIRNLRSAFKFASTLNPSYGVLHVGNVNIYEVLEKSYSSDDNKIISAFIEIVNSVVSFFPSQEPPFRILFENQWWPGLRMLDTTGYKILCNKIEFENWGLCFDTGHALVATGGAQTEDQAVNILEETISKFSKDIIESIVTVHLHTNTCYDYLKKRNVPHVRNMSITDIVNLAYDHVQKMDQHKPFTTNRVSELLQKLNPNYVTHEMGAPNSEQKIRDCLLQISVSQRSSKP